MHSIQLSVRYIQCTVVTAFPGRSKVALLLFARHPRRTAVLVILSLQNCSLLAHIFRLIIVALGYLAGALRDCLDGVSDAPLFLQNASPNIRSYVLHSEPSSVQEWSRLPGYVRGICSLLWSPRRSRIGGTTACVEVFAQHLILLYCSSSFPCPGLAYHNQRAEAANDQTPENGGLVARSPVDVLAGRGPEGDGRHCEMCVCVVGLGGERVAQEVLSWYCWWWRCNWCTDAC